MKRTTIDFAKLSFWAVVTCHLLLVTCHAVAEAGLSVSPPRVVLKGKPNKTLTGFYTVTNQGDQPLQVIVEPEDWAQGFRGGRGPVPWLQVKTKQLTLRPGKQARVKFTVRIPKDAKGELRAQVFFTTR